MLNKYLMTSQGQDNSIFNTNEQLRIKTAFAGGLAGALTRAISQPMDVIKIRFQLQVEPVQGNSKYSKYKSIPQAFQLVMREEGIRGLWKGHNSGQLLSIMFGLTQFYCYEEFIMLSKRYELLTNNKLLNNFICGGAAGAVAIVTTSPINVIRTRIIAQDESRGYRSSWQVNNN